MIHLSRETEALAIRLATAQHLSVDAAIQQALEERARTAGIKAPKGATRRMSVQEMLAVGSEIAALPVLDTRSANEIMDDLDAL